MDKVKNTKVETKSEIRGSDENQSDNPQVCDEIAASTKAQVAEVLDGMSLTELTELLEEAGIDTSLFGQGKAKTLNHLLDEVLDGEISLMPDETGELIRKVTVGTVNIFYISPDGQKFLLTEERQVFKDGRERQRDLKHSLSEKMKPAEDPESNMVRGIREELSIEGDIKLTKIREDEETVVSPSYPGLTTKYILHRFESMLTDEQFRPEGYIEEQPDKTNYFVWEKS